MKVIKFLFLNFRMFANSPMILHHVSKHRPLLGYFRHKFE